MSRSRRLMACAVAAVIAATSFPATAGAAPKEYLRGVLLTVLGPCGEAKNAYAAPHAPNLFAPMRLLDGNFVPTGEWLFPYEVTIVSGDEGLKARHLTPGETYARSGRLSKTPVECDLTATSKDIGEFEIHIVGLTRGQ